MCGKQTEATAPNHPGKTAALVPELAVEDLPSAELQPRFLNLQLRICRWAEYYDAADDYNDNFSIQNIGYLCVSSRLKY